MTKASAGTVQRTASVFNGMTSGTTAAIVASATALATGFTGIMQVVVQNDPDSANSIIVGPRNRQDVKVVAGASITLPIGDLSAVYVRGVGGAAIVNWLAMT